MSSSCQSHARAPHAPSIPLVPLQLSGDTQPGSRPEYGKYIASLVARLWAKRARTTRGPALALFRKVGDLGVGIRRFAWTHCGLHAEGVSGTLASGLEYRKEPRTSRLFRVSARDGRGISKFTLHLFSLMGIWVGFFVIVSMRVIVIRSFRLCTSPFVGLDDRLVKCGKPRLERGMMRQANDDSYGCLDRTLFKTAIHYSRSI
ncbi:hypothetical protein BS50DRAFT_284624 [Corynespora cassiicola Philippines]|uniref:Uncharacterized protein n=1 Tax=Corynespora cassiicola Philippines TaxID=1448308 RepID=A0A2T2P1F7_CORCC|nr:hypothetical protein BS50DRAFT_284624 [Corynespora cassiicola Philippines]